MPGGEEAGFVAFSALVLGETYPEIHRAANRATELTETHKFAELIPEEVEVDTHLDIGTGHMSPCSQQVLDDKEVSRSIGIDEHDVIECNGLHNRSNPVYQENNGRSPGGFIQGDAENLPIAEESVDLVTMGRFLNNLPRESRKNVYEEIDRVLDPEGAVVGDIKMYRPRKLHQMARHGNTGFLEFVTQSQRSKMYLEELGEIFEVEGETYWIDEDERPYMKALGFLAYKSQ